MCIRDRAEESRGVRNIDLKYDLGKGNNAKEIIVTGSYDIVQLLSLIHISEPTRLLSISYAVFCLKKKKNSKRKLKDFTHKQRCYDRCSN